jgi:Domain of unknown function (DUF4157)/DNA/RNA non-specific endonuclease
MNTLMATQAKPKATSAPSVRNKVLQRKCACGGTVVRRGECEECRKNRESKDDQFSEIPPIVHEVLNSPGQQLDPATRAFMEPRFGHDFGNVRVHTDARAAESARAVHAHAYTVGHNVVFAANEFAPGTRQGRDLLAHELAHTIQQRRASSAVQLVPPGSMLEAKAEQAGRDVTSGRSVTETLGSSELAVARQPVAADEEEEEEKEEETPVAMALPTAKASTAAPLPKASPVKPPRRRPPSQFEPGGVPYHLTDDGRVLTELEWSLEASSRREEERTKEREQKELQQSHDRLLILRGMLDRSGYIYTKSQIMAMITKDSLLDGQILRHYGVDLPPSWYRKRKTFTDYVIEAIDKFDNEWRHGAASAGPLDIEGLQARQTQQENEAANFEGYSYTTESALAGAGASTTRLFTDDPKKIAAGAGLGAATAGSLGAAGYAKGQQGTYSPQVEGPGPFADPVGRWRYTGPAPTTSAPAPPPVVPEPPVVPDAPPKTTTPKIAPAPKPKVAPKATVSPKDKPLTPLPSGDPRGTIRATPGGYQTTKPSQPEVIVRRTTGRTPDPAASFDPYQPSKTNVAGEYRFRQFEKGGKSYQQADGRLGMPNEVQTHRDVTAQRKVSGGTGDDAGHLIGNRFGPPGSAENLGRQNWVANRVGNYHALEDAWAGLRRQGVQIDVQVTDVTRIGEDRPFMRNVQWTETAPDGSVKSYEVDFANTTTPESRVKSGHVSTSGSGKVIKGDFGKQ